MEEVGADVNQADNQGYTPLHGAALTEDREVMLYLIATGADVKARASMIFGGIGRNGPGTSMGQWEIRSQTWQTVRDHTIFNTPRPLSFFSILVQKTRLTAEPPRAWSRTSQNKPRRKRRKKKQVGPSLLLPVAHPTLKLVERGSYHHRHRRPIDKKDPFCWAPFILNGDWRPLAPPAERRPKRDWLVPGRGLSPVERGDGLSSEASDASRVILLPIHLRREGRDPMRDRPIRPLAGPLATTLSCFFSILLLLLIPGLRHRTAPSQKGLANLRRKLQPAALFAPLSGQPAQCQQARGEMDLRRS